MGTFLFINILVFINSLEGRQNVMIRKIFIFCFVLSGCTDKNAINAKNLKRVRVGMTQNQVIEIMGVPPRIIPSWEEKNGDYVYQYGAPILYYSDIYIFFSHTDSAVLRINDGGKQ